MQPPIMACAKSAGNERSGYVFPASFHSVCVGVKPNKNSTVFFLSETKKVARCEHVIVQHVVLLS